MAFLGLTGAADIPSLEEIYVDQTASRSLALPYSSSQQQSAVDAVLASDCVLVIGDSGIGKSTLLTVAALRCLRGGGIPFFLELASLETMLVEAARGRMTSGGLRLDAIFGLIRNELEFFGLQVERVGIEQVLEKHKVLLLLDGLNELRDDRLRNMILSVIPTWRSRWPLLRVVVSSTAYIVDEGTVAPPHTMGVLRLTPLGFEQAAVFLDTFVRVTRPDLTAKARDDMWQPALRRLRRNPEVFGYPLYLTAIAVTLISGTFISRDEDLHSSFDVMKRIARWLSEHQSETIQQDISSVDLYRAISCIAYYLATSDLRPRVTAGLHDVVAAVTRALPDLSARVDVDTVITEIATRGGLIRKRWGDITMLELLRDFFACQYLATHHDDNDAPTWRGWISRGLSVRENQGMLRFLPLALLENSGTIAVRELYDSVVSAIENMPLDSACEVTAALTRPLRDLSLRGFLISELSDKWRAAIADLAVSVDAAESGSNIPLTSRVSLATASAMSNQPAADEFRSQVIWFRSPEPFVIGGQAVNPLQPNFDEDAAPWELTPRKVLVQPFGIGKYPVTVVEFEEFVDVGGYEDPHYWSTDAQTWIQRFGWRKPLDWELQLTDRSSPVTGVSFYEAAAYAAWVNASQHRGRLLTELEWEYAARHGHQTRFPWGDSISYGDKAEANWAGAGLRLKTPVGLFRQFGTVDGVQDMVGNVEEWCTDEWNADQEIYQHVGVEGKRVVKGGSCIRYRRLCRPAYRSRVLAWTRYHTLGFRLGFALESSNG